VPAVASPPPVIPAKPESHDALPSNPSLFSVELFAQWIPVFAGWDGGFSRSFICQPGLEYPRRMSRKPPMPNNNHRLSISRSGNASSRRSAARFELEAGYRAMASDDDHEREALAWIEGLVGDVADDPVD
jgi:hypothetical protein